jgi:hypothetical protein
MIFMPKFRTLVDAEFFGRRLFVAASTGVPIPGVEELP